MKIAMISSEANPLFRSGGLAEVVYSLSRELNKEGHETIIILPYYKTYKNGDFKPEFVGSFNIFMSWRNQYAGIFKASIDGLDFYLIDNEQYFMRDNLYGYKDDDERFAFFSLASLEALRMLGFKPDVIHVHDWQVGMIPCLIKEKYKNDAFLGKVKTVLTIHNPSFKGYTDKYNLNNYYGLSDSLYDMGKVRFDGLVSTLKAGVVFADQISTVSPTHRNELLDPLSSFKFSYVLELRRDDFKGIVNGIDTDEFNPEKDPKINKTYSKTSFVKAKEANKKDLFKSIPMAENKGPLFGVVSRLTQQKGLELLFANVDYMISKGASIIFLGSGEKEYENQIQALRDKYPERIGVYIGYNDALSHKIFAGSDFFLMPSEFEPCGISQLISQRYGTIPVARATGGLADTIIPLDESLSNVEKANGILFNYFSVEDLKGSIDLAFKLFEEKTKMDKMIKFSMNTDTSWSKSAIEYIHLYERALSK